MDDRSGVQVRQVVDVINQLRDDPIQLEHRFEVGEGAGAYAVRLANGSEAVLKWWPRTAESVRDCHLRPPRINRLRDLGWPIPPLLEWGSTPDILYEVWGFASGKAGVHRPMPAAMVGQAVELLHSAKGAALGDGSDWPTWLTTSVRTAMSRAKTNAGPAARDLLIRCEAALEEATLGPGKDIIHGDFTPANCLLEGDRIVAVVDFDACRDGDTTIDLMGLAFDLEGWEKKAEPAVIDGLWRQILSNSEPETANALLAYWVASGLAWAAGTEWEGHVVATAQRAWNRLL